MPILEDVKLNLRFTHDMLDEDISSDISSCLKDLYLGGVNRIEVEDSLISKAIKLYCRWQVNYENQGERYRVMYTTLKNALASSTYYGGQKE